jgi:acetoin utilization deacetylase AcuC-like enzyme
MAALATAIDAITAWGADSLVLALGLDAFEGDPFAGLGVTTPGFARIGQAVADMGLPTVIIQEGGYLCPDLGENLKAVLGRFA